MKMLVSAVCALALAIACSGLFTSGALADVKADICDKRAATASGYSPMTPGGLTWRTGRTKFTLSGTLYLGVGRSSGGSSGSIANMGGRDHNLDKARDKYHRLYDDCMGLS